MRKLKKTCKKAKGLKIRLVKEQFLDQLKNPQKYISTTSADNAKEILRKIRSRNKTVPSPYDSGYNGAMARLKRLTGLR